MEKGTREKKMRGHKRGRPRGEAPVGQPKEYGRSRNRNRNRRSRAEKKRLQIDSLPDELLASILSHIDCLGLATACSLVCRRWHAVIQDASALGRRLCPHAAVDFKERFEREHGFAFDLVGPDMVQTNFLELFDARRLPRLQRRDRAIQHLTITPVGQLAIAAATAGHLVCVQGIAPLCHVYAFIGYAAALGGHVSVLRFALAQRYPTDEWTCALAAQGGSLACLRLLHEADCPWDEQTVALAIARGHDDCLDYALREECPKDCTMMRTCLGDHKCDVDATDTDFGNWMAGRKARGAQRAQRAHLCRGWEDMGDRDHRHLACLLRAQEAGVVLRTRCFKRRLIKAGHLLCMRHFLPPGVVDFSRDGGRSECARAAASGHLDVLRFLREVVGCTWDQGVCLKAARYNRLDILEYAHRNGCPITVRVSERAAKWDHIDCLAYAHEHGFPWAATVCAKAAHAGNLGCLEWLREHGCPWDEATTIACVRAGRADALLIVRERGCPWSKDTLTAALTCNCKAAFDCAYRAGCPHSDAIVRRAQRRGWLPKCATTRLPSCPRRPLVAAQGGRFAVLADMGDA